MLRRIINWNHLTITWLRQALDTGGYRPSRRCHSIVYILEIILNVGGQVAGVGKI